MAHDTNCAAFGPSGLIREERKKKKKERWGENQRIGYEKKNKLSHDFDYNTC
jgi:hypothetical protein